MTSAADLSTTPSAVAAPARPPAVTVAFWLQCGLVFALLVLIGVSVAGAIRYNSLIEQAAAGTTPDPDDLSFERSANVSDALISSLPLTVLAVWLGVTACWTRRGSNIARILTWVGLGAPVLLGGVFCVLGSLLGMFAFAALSSMPENGSYSEDGTFTPGFPTDEPAFDGSDFYDRLATLDSSGGWSLVLDALGTSFAVIAFLLAVAVAVLLMTGPAHRYFRPETSKPPPPIGPWYPGQPVPGQPFRGAAPAMVAGVAPPGTGPYGTGPYPAGSGYAYPAVPFPPGAVGSSYPAGPYPPGSAAPTNPAASHGYGPVVTPPLSAPAGRAAAHSPAASAGSAAPSHTAAPHPSGPGVTHPPVPAPPRSAPTAPPSTSQQSPWAGPSSTTEGMPGPASSDSSGPSTPHTPPTE